MKRRFLLMVTVVLLLNCSLNVCAKEAQVKENVIENDNVGLELRALPTDIGSIKLEQVAQSITIPEQPFQATENLVNNAEVIYRLRYKVTAKRVNNQIVTNYPIDCIVFTGPIKGSKFTNIDSSGVGYIDVDVRGPHNITIYCRLKNSSVRSNTVTSSVNIRADYAKNFWCTGYFTALESDYSGAKTSAKGIANDTFKSDFLEKVKVNGSGKADNGKFLHYDSSTGSFSYMNPTTATGTSPDASRTIAVDPYYIPRAKVNSVWKRATVSIANIGTRVAEDGGRLIVGYHLDVYRGIGNVAMQGWSNLNRKVTLMSVN